MRIFYVCIFAAVVIAAVVIFCSLIMMVSEVQVAGSSRYSEADILSACPIQPQDNLLTADTEAAALAIEQKLPYVGEAIVKRKFPSRIVVTVSEAEKLGTALDGAKYYKNTVIPAMEKARDFADKLELKTGKKYWPFPTYEDLLFGVN